MTAATPPDDPANPGLEQELRESADILGNIGDHSHCTTECSEKEAYEQEIKILLDKFAQREAQAYERGRRDERMDCLTVAEWWIENDGRPKHLLNDLAEDDKTTLDHIPELEKGKPDGE